MEFGGVLLILLLVVLGITLNLNYREAQRRHAHEVAIERLQSNLNSTLSALETMRDQMLSIANVTFDAIIVIDKQRHVTLMNDAARSLFQIEAPPASALTQTLMAVTRHHQLDGLVDKALERHEPLEDQLEINGRWYKVRVTQLETGTIVLALQDVTELLRLTRARRDMVANISHELRTPISSIRLLVDTLSQNIGRNPERDTRLLGKIGNETDSLQYLVEELHDLSMIESGRAIMRMVETPFNDIARDAINRVVTQVEQKKLELSNQIADDICVLADPDQTRRVLTNLISNAVKCTPSGGKITFSAERGDSMVTIQVTDTGPGISPSERSRVFERFYQIDTARSGSPQGGGSGLGLSIAKHIIEAQGGKIWAEGALPHGTRICFTLPRAG